MLNKLQTKFLRKSAHNLKPYVWIGQKGLTKLVADEVNQALSSHELLKISIRVGAQEAKKQLVAKLAQQMGAEVIDSIGNTAVFFRRNLKKPKIELPK